MALGDKGMISYRQYFYLRQLLLDSGEFESDEALEELTKKEATVLIRKHLYKTNQNKR